PSEAPTSRTCVPKFRCTKSKDKYAVPHDCYARTSLGYVDLDLCDEPGAFSIVSPTAIATKQPKHLAEERQKFDLQGKQARGNCKRSPKCNTRASSGTDREGVEGSFMGSQSEARLGASFPPPGRVSQTGLLVEQRRVIPHGQKSVSNASERAATGNTWADSGIGGGGSSTIGSDKCGMREKTGPCRMKELAHQQQEKDQRLWSALRTTLLSSMKTDEFGNSGKVKGMELTSEDISFSRAGLEPSLTPSVGIDGKEVGRDMSRNMQQLDFERSAMDRNMRLHRIASARIETKVEPSSSFTVENKFKQSRNSSEYSSEKNSSPSTAQCRKRQSQSQSQSLSCSAGGIQCTGIRAELLPRKGDEVACSSTSTFDGGSLLHSGTGTKRQECLDEFSAGEDHGGLRWATDNEGMANLLRRPPSRQKDAF
ncbi:unnamed protein product, partial [Choristocarpus tenellus]